MKLYKTKGIILKRQDLGEADRILTIYTVNQGKVRTLAKGVRKILSKLGGHLELFNLVNLGMIQGKGLDTITACQTIEPFRNLRSNLKKTSLACYVTELVDGFTLERQKDYRIYRLLEEFFILLDNRILIDTKKLYLAVRSFELKLLFLLGYAPELKKCLACGKLIKPDLNYFSVNLGGLLCSECRRQDIKSIKISPDTIKITKYLLEKDFSLVSRLKLNKVLFCETRNIITSFVKYILQRELKARDFVKKTERLG